MGEFLIDGIWILRNYSGICLFEEIYTDFKREGVSKDLVTGLLSAIVNFAEEAFIDRLEYIKFRNHKIILKFTELIIFVIALRIEPATIEERIHEKIDLIMKKFEERFQGLLNNWDGDTDIFNNFSEDLKNIVKRKPLTIKLIMELKLKQKQLKKEARRERRRSERLNG